MAEMSTNRKFLAANRLISYTSEEFIEKYLHEIGGITVNWLHFFQLEVVNIDHQLLELWDDPMLLQEHNLYLRYYQMIPEALMQRHAELHTQLSNEIQRMDYCCGIGTAIYQGRNSSHVPE